MTTMPPSPLKQQLGPAPNARKLLPRRLRNILSLGDFENAARRHLPRPIFGYISGGVEDNASLAENRASFAIWMF
jgi:L-lactate dehydrogenase (cytochrome)